MYWNFYSVCSWAFRGRCISRPTLPMKVLVEVWKSQLMIKRVIEIWVELGRPYSSAYDRRFGCQWKWLLIKVSREISRDQRIRSKGPECNETSRIPERKTGSCCFAFYTLLNLISFVMLGLLGSHLVEYSMQKIGVYLGPCQTSLMELFAKIVGSCLLFS